MGGRVGGWVASYLGLSAHLDIELVEVGAAQPHRPPELGVLDGEHVGDLGGKVGGWVGG